MSYFDPKLPKHERERLAKLPGKTIKPEQRVEKEPKGDPILPIRSETNKD